MANDLSTIQSLKAVDAWIDVINANINGGVRTAFKASRLRFAGSNTTLDRAPTSSTLPLQFPEPGLITANTVIDWTQGAITSSTEHTHLAIQGDGFFMLATPDAVDPDGTAPDGFGGDTKYSATAMFYLTRDGEFHTDQHGYLRHSSGLYLVTPELSGAWAVPPHRGGVPYYSSTLAGGAPSTVRLVYNDIDNPNPVVGTNNLAAIRLSEFISQDIQGTINGSLFGTDPHPPALVQVTNGQQNLKYSQYGSTVYDFGFKLSGGAALGTIDPNVTLQMGSAADAAILGKSLEASNSSMTQSVPELSLAQKLFSALTKVLQIGQTNTDSVLNLVR